MTTPLTAGCSALVLCVCAAIASEALTTIAGAAGANVAPGGMATAACDVTSGTAHNSSWGILAGWAIRDERWAYPYAEGQSYRFVGGDVYLDHRGSWQRWNEGLQRWEPTTPPSCETPPPSCDVTSGTAHNSSWGILAGWAIRDERWAYPYAEGQSYRFVGGDVYLDHHGSWQRWNEGLQRWEGTAAPACSGADAAPLTDADAGLNVKFAYWNLYGGTGKKSLTGACFDRFGNPVTEPAGAPGSTYPTWWAAAGPGRPAFEAFMADVAVDPEVIAVGVGESWGAGAHVFPHLGWEGQSDGRPQKTPETREGDQILARYGFVDREDYLLGSFTLPDSHTTLQYWANYADVCLDRQCGRRMPFFSTHYQALQHPTDAWGQFDPAGTYEAGIERLLAYMDLKAGVGTPRVLAGDLNAWDPQTDRHICTAASEPGPSHVTGIRRLRDGAGYTDAWRMIHPWGRADTGSLNRSDAHYQNCLIANGLAPGAPYKRIDYIFTKDIHAITSAEYVGAPFGSGGKGTVAWGNCVGSDHVGVKVGIHVP